MVNEPRVAFIGWNPFQFIHIKNLAEALPGSCLLVEKRKDYLSEFGDDILKSEDVPVMIWEQSKMASLDGVFDIIVCQTPFFRIEEFSKTKIVMIQYGYAKEPHNYGAWRSLADLCLTYGTYAENKISAFTNAVSVGNPRYDSWNCENFHLKTKIKHTKELDPTKKTILYLPTWGDLSSVDQYLSEIYLLSENYNIVLKMHHNTELLEADRKQRVTDGTIVHYGANDDLMELLSICDIVISDYSGAIFDAIFCKKPVVLLNSNLDDQLGGKKIDNHSIEYSRRNELGFIVNSPSELKAGVANAFINYEKAVTAQDTIRRELFIETSNSTQLAVDAILGLWKGQFKLQQTHQYIRSEIKELYKTKRQLNIANKKLSGLK